MAERTESSDFEGDVRTLLGLVVITLVGAVATAAGVGGGAIFLPIFNALVGFAFKPSTALSQACIAAGALAGLLINLPRTHPANPHLPLVDFPALLLLAPLLLVGAGFGVILNVLLPAWLLTVLLVMLLALLVVQAVAKARVLWQTESQRKAASATADLLDVPVSCRPNHDHNATPALEAQPGSRALRATSGSCSCRPIDDGYSGFPVSGEEGGSSQWDRAHQQHYGATVHGDGAAAVPRGRPPPLGTSSRFGASVSVYGEAGTATSVSMYGAVQQDAVDAAGSGYGGVGLLVPQSTSDYPAYPLPAHHHHQLHQRPCSSSGAAARRSTPRPATSQRRCVSYRRHGGGDVITTSPSSPARPPPVMLRSGSLLARTACARLAAKSSPSVRQKSWRAFNELGLPDFDNGPAMPVRLLASSSANHSGYLVDGSGYPLGGGSGYPVSQSAAPGSSGHPDRGAHSGYPGSGYPVSGQGPFDLDVPPTPRASASPSPRKTVAASLMRNASVARRTDSARAAVMATAVTGGHSPLPAALLLTRSASLVKTVSTGCYTVTAARAALLQSQSSRSSGRPPLPPLAPSHTTDGAALSLLQGGRTVCGTAPAEAASSVMRRASALKLSQTAPGDPAGSCEASAHSTAVSTGRQTPTGGGPLSRNSAEPNRIGGCGGGGGGGGDSTGSGPSAGVSVVRDPSLHGCALGRLSGSTPDSGGIAAGRNGAPGQPGHGPAGFIPSCCCCQQPDGVNAAGTGVGSGGIRRIVDEMPDMPPPLMPQAMGLETLVEEGDLTSAGPSAAALALQPQEVEAPPRRLPIPRQQEPRLQAPLPAVLPSPSAASATALAVHMTTLGDPETFTQAAAAAAAAAVLTVPRPTTVSSPAARLPRPTRTSSDREAAETQVVLRVPGNAGNRGNGEAAAGASLGKLDDDGVGGEDPFISCGACHAAVAIGSAASAVRAQAVEWAAEWAAALRRVPLRYAGPVLAAWASYLALGVLRSVQARCSGAWYGLLAAQLAGMAAFSLCAGALARAAVRRQLHLEEEVLRIVVVEEDKEGLPQTQARPAFPDGGGLMGGPLPAPPVAAPPKDSSGGAVRSPLPDNGGTNNALHITAGKDGGSVEAQQPFVVGPPPKHRRASPFTVNAGQPSGDGAGAVCEGLDASARGPYERRSSGPAVESGPNVAAAAAAEEATATAAAAAAAAAAAVSSANYAVSPLKAAGIEAVMPSDSQLQRTGGDGGGASAEGSRGPPLLPPKAATTAAAAPPVAAAVLLAHHHAGVQGNRPITWPPPPAAKAAAEVVGEYGGDDVGDGGSCCEDDPLLEGASALVLDSPLLVLVVTLAAGVLGGMLGLGGGMIMGPLLLQVGVHPQVTAATSGCLVLFSSTAALTTFALLGKLNYAYAGVFAAASFVAGVVGTKVVADIVRRSGRPSVVVMALFLVMAVGLVSVAAFGGIQAASDLGGGHMGFHGLCES